MLGRLKRLFTTQSSTPETTLDFPTDLASDPRWRRLNDRNYTCKCCGESLQGVYDIGYDHPDPWPHGNREQSNLPVLSVGDDALGTDFCQLDGQFYLRCTLRLPIVGSDKHFAYGPWASLSEASKEAYADAELAGNYDDFPQCFGWMCNMLPGFENENPLPATVVFGDGSLRPELWIHDGAHPLADAQRDGITLDQLLDIYAAAGNDMRPHLLDS